YLTWLAHRAGADWIVLFDAEEFWFGDQGTVVEVLRQSRNGRVQAALAFDVLPASTDGINFTDPNALGRMVPEPGMQKVAVRPNR
ncbi:hypothetical protein R0K17_27275, partial [Planococcus sp. SIMBA_143]